MRHLIRNKRQFAYAKYEGFTENKTDDGFYTSESTPEYGGQIIAYANISTAGGVISNQGFGVQSEYTRTMVTNEQISPMDRIWFDCPYDGPHNYTAQRIGDSKNETVYALIEVVS